MLFADAGQSVASSLFTSHKQTQLSSLNTSTEVLLKRKNLVPGWYQVLLVWTHRDLVLSDAGEEGRSLQALAEMRMASSMAASSPLPPSPLRAGPKHSGRRISSRTTTLAFSSTLSPTGETRCQLKQDIVGACLYPRAAMVQSVCEAHSEQTTNM